MSGEHGAGHRSGDDVAGDARPRATEPDLPTGGRETLDDARTTVELPRPTLTGPDAEIPPEVRGDDASDDDVDDNAVTEELAPAPELAAQSGSKRGLFVVLGLVLFVAMAGPIVFYFFVWRYKPVALAHVPAGSNLAVRIDAKELYLFTPFREQVLGPLDSSSGAEKRADRLKTLTGIDLRGDLREIVIASPDAQRFVVLLGGYFSQPRMNRASAMKGLSEFFTQEHIEGFTLQGDIIEGPNGMQIAQAEDSTIIIASDAEMLRASREPTDAWKELGLAGSGALSFTVDGPALAHAAKALESIGGVPAIAHTQRATGFMKLGDKPELSVELLPQQIDSEALAKEAEEAIKALDLMTVLLPDAFGEKAALENAQVRPRNASVLITARWPADGLEEAMKRIGEKEKAFFDAAPTPP